VDLYRWRDVRDPADLPAPEELAAWTEDLLRDHATFRAADKGEPYSGPVLLRGTAAGVFVHEILGHRAEGHRQKDEDEGQTFREMVGEVVVHPAISVFDDPTLTEYRGLPLNGHYRYDEEGQPARRVDIIRDGVFEGFLMNRSPIRGFTRSNGHGRAMPGLLPVSRMGNTILETSDPRPADELRRLLVREARAQGREFGLVVDEIAGGFTMTGRTFPNSFNVRVETAWRVYVDGRPDEPVRGIDLVGTPLVALGSIAAAGDDPAVFNGFCGAESGSIPVGSISPSLLLLQLEVQRKEKDQDRPPLLPRPDQGGES
jgi:predicted Zn-dependent protease